MALLVTPVHSWDDGQKMHVIGTIAASGSYTTGGDTLDFTPVAAGFKGRNLGIASPPEWVHIEGFAGYTYSNSIGTLLNNSLMKTQQAPSAGSNPLSEISASAYPAAVIADTISFYAVFKKLQ